MPPTTAIIWDWNGTLLDDLGQALAAMNVVLDGLGLPCLDDRDAYRSVFGFPVRDFYARLGIDVDPGGQYEAAANRYLRAYEERVVGATLQPNARETLRTFRKARLEQVLISASPTPRLHRQLAPHNLDPYLHAVYGSGNDALAPSKEHVVQWWLANCHHDPDSVVMIGDTVHDREIAESAGVRFISYAGGHQAAPEDGRHPVIEDLCDLASLLK